MKNLLSGRHLEYFVMRGKYLNRSYDTRFDFTYKKVRIRQKAAPDFTFTLLLLLNAKQVVGAAFVNAQ